VTARSTKPRCESCREEILQAALRRFAHCGYAGASIQDIVDEARVTKPALYYHFPSKEALYRALVDHAHDERFRLMQEGAARGRTTAAKLTEIGTALFEFSQRNQELMRLTLAAAFAAPGEVPALVKNLAKGKRNFELICSLVAAGQQAGELASTFTVEELSFGIYGQMNTYIMAHLLLPDCHLNRRKASRVVKLFLEGARAPKHRAR
jgi:AcrR family transcriptional regulator